MIEIAKLKNPNSKSNGSLTRCTPIPIYGTIKKMSLDEISNLAIQDSSLTHSNSIVQEVNSVYCISIASLLQNPKNINICLENAKKYIKNEDVMTWFSTATNSSLTNIVENMRLELDALSDYRNQSGYLKHAFILAFSLLVNKISYKEAISVTLMCGGDTDTNACIVGGLLGAYWGFNELPKEQIIKMLKYKYEENDLELGHDRPVWLKTNNILDIIKKY